MTPSRTSQLVAFLRGINVGATGKGRKAVPMVELRKIASQLGFHGVQTYLQSGNLIFRCSIKPISAEKRLEAAIATHFGFEVPVLVRSLTELIKARAACPFESAASPKLLHIGFAKGEMKRDATKQLLPYCQAGERVALSESSFWIDYPKVQGSKLTPAVLQRAFGSPVTMRNSETLDAVVALSDPNS